MNVGSGLPRLRRSMLMTPGNRPDRMRKAASTGADALVLGDEHVEAAVACPLEHLRERGALLRGDSRERSHPGVIQVTGLLAEPGDEVIDRHVARLSSSYILASCRVRQRMPRQPPNRRCRVA